MMMKPTLPPIAMSLWGKDHWSTLAYLETRVVDHGGIVSRQQLRCNSRIHPQFAHVEGAPYDTRLIGGSIASEHDDWSCIEDMVAVGLVMWDGSGLDPVFSLTDYGWRVAGLLRRHIAETRKSGTFVPPAIEQVT